MKNKGGPLGHFLKFEKFPKKIKMRSLNSVTVPKNVIGDHLGFFDIHCVAKYKKIEGGPFGEIQKASKKVA